MTHFKNIHSTRTAFDATGSGPPLLMMHGAEGSRRSFTRLLPHLTDHFTVITYDQRDCGDTVNPEAPASLAMLADDAHALLQELGHASALVFGTSFGGRVAQAFAVRHPDAVRRLVLSSTWPLPVRLADVHGEAAHQMGLLRAGLPATAEQLAEYFFPAAFLAEQPQFRQHFKSAPARSARSDRRSVAVADMPDLDITRIGAPTLLTAGDADRVIPAELTRSLAGYIRNTRTVMLAGLGHLSYVQAPERLAQPLLEFLSEPGANG